MADIDLKTETPDTSLPTTGFLFGADSQAAASPSVYSTQTVATTLLGSTSLTGATVTADSPVLNLAQTWNNAAVTFTGLKLNVTDTASNASSILMDLQVGGTSAFKVQKNAAAFVAGASGSTATQIGARLSSDTVSRVVVGLDSSDSGIFAIGPGGSSARDAFISRRGTANLRLGAADAAAPFAQTLSVQSVVAGTSNTAGANFTITGSQGTGTGAGGSIIFQVAPAGSSGTAQNALVEAFRIQTGARIRVANASIAGAGGSGFYSLDNTAIGFGQDAGSVVWGGIASGGFVVSNALYYGFGSSGTSTPDLFLTRRAAANLRLGAADAAAPVAQTLSVQSVVAGTSNTAGANLTITGSQGTGTGAGGSIIFQVAPAGSSGSAQNALATALTINPSGTVSIGGLTIDPSNGGITFLQTFGIIMQTSNAFVIRHGNNDGLDVRPVSSGAPNILLKNASNAIQSALWGEATNTLALRNGANAQTFSVYNTYTDASNYERLSLFWNSNLATIFVDKAGTGQTRNLALQSYGTIRLLPGNTDCVEFSSSLVSVFDGKNIQLGTTNGTKIGTATSQKIGFWNATPIVQPTTAVAAATVAATGTGDVVAASTTFDGYTIPQIVKALRNAGLLA